MPVEIHRIPILADQSIVVDWYPAAPGARVAVFVHGLGSNRRGEKVLHFARAFNAQGWAFATLDLRGHGESGGSIRELTLSNMLTDLRVLLAWVAAREVAEQPVLIGSSMGGAVIAWHALEQKVASLVMIAPSLRFPLGIAAQIGPEAMQEWQRVGVRAWRSEWIDLEIGFGLMQDAAKYDFARLEQGLHSATLILHGMADDAVDWRHSAAFAAACRHPHVDLLLMKDGDHRLTDRKELLFDIIWAWLQRREHNSHT